MRTRTFLIGGLLIALLGFAAGHQAAELPADWVLSTPTASVAPIEPAPPTSSKPPSCDRQVEEQTARVQGLTRALDHAGVTRDLLEGWKEEREGIAAAWDAEGIPNGERPEAFHAATKTAIADLPGVVALTPDCSEYPCIGYLRVDLDVWDDSFDVLMPIKDAWPATSVTQQNISATAKRLPKEEQDYDIVVLSIRDPQAPFQLDTRLDHRMGGPVPDEALAQAKEVM